MRPRTPAFPSESREQRGRRAELHGTLLGGIPGLLLATATFWNSSEVDFLFLVLCLCEIEFVNPVTEGPEREKSR